LDTESFNISIAKGERAPEDIDYSRYFPVPPVLMKMLAKGNSQLESNDSRVEDSVVSNNSIKKSSLLSWQSSNKDKPNSNTSFQVFSNNPLKTFKNFPRERFQTDGFLPFLVSEQTKPLKKVLPQSLSLRQKSKQSIPIIISEPHPMILMEKSDNSFKPKKQRKSMKELKIIIDNKPCKCPEIMIVDDNGYNLLVLRVLIESLGLKVDSANSGKEAITLVENRLKSFADSKCKCKIYKVIFMDLDMPEKDGIETTQEINELLLPKLTPEKERSTSIIACTAFSEMEFGEKCSEAGMHGYINKPVKKDLLESTLIKFINKYF
jgi:CheY-like chemotaxis protein